jgi:hypothetical protein
MDVFYQYRRQYLSGEYQSLSIAPARISKEVHILRDFDRATFQVLNDVSCIVTMCCVRHS